MSAIAGVYNLDARPVDASLLARMTDRVAHRGPDGVGHWIDGSVGLGHRMLRTTPESEHEEQPFVDARGTLCLTVDGRVDNRQELTAALAARGVRVRTDTDAEMILRAYELWGTDCPKRIIGDFAFAIWDRRRQHLFCARDPLGMRPFYYYSDGRTFLFGSELAQLFEDARVRREPNEGMIGEYLASAIISREETLYRGVLRLPSAHTLLVRPGRLQKDQYWSVDPTRAVRYRSDDEYAEHFLEIFSEAVRCRLRSNGPVGAHLSGGLDSSSVSVMAQSLYRSGAVTDTGFETFSLVYPGLPCDESAYIQATVDQAGLRSNLIPYRPLGRAHYADQLRRHCDFPDYPNGATYALLYATARERGIRTLLTGRGGNQWLEGRVEHLADLLRALRIPQLLTQARFDTRVLGTGSPTSLVLRPGLQLLLPRIVRRTVRIVRRRSDLPSWLDAAFARRTQLVERLRHEERGQRYASVAQRSIYLRAISGWQIHFDEICDRISGGFSFEQRHPFNDRRLVEFALALPEEQRWRRDQRRFVLRRAMRHYLPETVRQRVIQADLSDIFVKTFQALGGARFFDSLTIGSLGWIDQAQAGRMYRNMMQHYANGDQAYTEHLWPLWMILGIELWYAHSFS